MGLLTDARAAPAVLEERFRQARAGPSDIHEHLDRLRTFASRCEHVTEFGIRGANASTVALLAGQPAELVCWDVNPWAVVQQAVADLLVGAGRTRFQPRVGDSRTVTIEPTELLFVDTVHTYAQLVAELRRHGAQVGRWIALHDTATYGDVGDDGSRPGLRAAVRAFLADAFLTDVRDGPRRSAGWRVLEDHPHNNGLMILERR